MYLLVDVQCRLQKKIKNVYRRPDKGMLFPNSDQENGGERIVKTAFSLALEVLAIRRVIVSILVL
jgi:hypothetical protein